MDTSNENRKEYSVDEGYNEKGKFIVVLGVASLLFGLLCLISGLIAPTLTTGESISLDEIPKDTVVGSFTVKSNRQIVAFLVKQEFVASSRDKWRSFTIDVLDVDSLYVCTVGAETFYETGYDSEGVWTEARIREELLIVLDEGVYNVRIRSEESSENVSTLFSSLLIEQRLFGALPFFLVGGFSCAFALIIGIILGSNADSTEDDED